MKITEASILLEVPEKNIREFQEVDPFNDANTLHGYISMSEANYGSLVIDKVNHFKTKQVVVGTPKQHYPFDKLGRWNFPIAEHVNIYEKYDGTNILAYKYQLKGRDYLTYKTRLSPVLKGSKWGNFIDMWSDMLKQYPKIVDYMNFLYNINLSFELFGARNRHLIDYYPVLLDCVLLFGIQNDIKVIIDPEQLDTVEFFIPRARLEARIVKRTDLTAWYQKLRGQQEAINKSTEDGIVGSEGFVWYLQDTKGVMHQYKCKPETIERIHWASGGISRGSIITTIMNAYESTDDVTYDYVLQLLKEEFTQQTIEKYHYRIKECMQKVKDDLEFRDTVLDKYKADGLDLTQDKNGTMRSLSKYFEKKEMRKVYSCLKVYVDREEQ